MAHLNLLRPQIQTLSPTSGSRVAPDPPLSQPGSRRHSISSSVFDYPIRQDPVTNQSFNEQPRATNLLDTRTTPGTPRSRRGSPSYIVISGGTGCNGIVNAFGSNVTYVLPVSDNGGSSSEIIRVLGGPSIGDIRSRLIRLIPSAPHTSPQEAIRALLSHRLPVTASEHEAREEWRDIVEGRSPLWRGIPADRKETIRGFLVYFENELLRRAQKKFSFRNGSIGNYFLTACHLFFRSVPSAIFLFSSITGSQAHILPVIITNHTATIAAELENGSTIIGQCEISHPVAQPSPGSVEKHIDPLQSPDDEDHELMIGAEASRGRNVSFAKQDEKDHLALESRIQRVYYINQYGQEIFPKPNPEFLKGVGAGDVLVYSIGSLWTSIIPCLALKGVASAIVKSQSLLAKVLLLNACNDRETDGYTAVDYIQSIVQTLNYHDQAPANTLPSPMGQRVTDPKYPPSAFVTHLVYLENTDILVDLPAITALGIQCICVQPRSRFKPPFYPVSNLPKIFEARDVENALEQILQDISN